ASAAAWLFQETIREQLARRVVFDYAAQRQQALEELNRRLGQLGGDGLQIEGRADHLAVAEVAVGEAGLVLVGETRGRLTATLQPWGEQDGSPR
ncbi:MAG: DUF4403 family protein, partial [Candidatus Competibacteraceae bacterium]|nr:DUF4403 family protein [Candidatus Competibacteraceae bacterium]